MSGSPDRPALMPDALPYLSLVLPAYNEEGNLEQAVAQSIAPLSAITESWEIVIVNDASTDRTPAVADGLAAAHPGRVRVVHHAQNAGLGGAIRTGFAAARGDVLAYCDADLPFDMDDLVRAHEILVATGADVVNGVRVNRKDLEGPRRRAITRVYNAIIEGALHLGVRDVNCPLKLVRRSAYERMDLRSIGCFIDAEILAEARRAGLKIEEVDAHYRIRVEGVSTLTRPSVVLAVLRDVALFRTGRLRDHHPSPPDRRPAHPAPAP